MARSRNRKQRSKVIPYQGINFKSKLEIEIYKQLRKCKTHEIRYEKVKLPYILERQYIPDFICSGKNGMFFIEVKGYLRPEDRSKMLAAIEANPGLDLRLLFSKDNVLRKGSKTKYSDWCKKHNIPYAIGVVPKEWFT
jgi:predicted nuclease of restriction endonuclease-like RecB superfamily